MQQIKSIAHRLCPRIFLLSIALLSVPYLSIGCAKDCTPEKPCCESGKDCQCGSGVDVCTIDCTGINDCKAVCDDQFGECNISCDGNCDSTCKNGDQCNLSCGDDCSMTCSSASGCEVECGDNCNYDCRSTSDCTVKAGNQSEIHCESVGDCQVICEGDCRVDCPQSGSCSLECVTENSSTPGTNCGGTTYACGPC